MIKLKELLVERIDYQETATQLVKQYGLSSKVKFGKVKGQNEADYDWVKDVINLKRSYPNVKEFIVSVLHEIDHAIDSKKRGWKKFKLDYEWEMNYQISQGKDEYKDNKYEIEAEEFGQKNYRKWLQKFKKDGLF